jgi:hypothetical protein
MVGVLAMLGLLAYLVLMAAILLPMIGNVPFFNPSKKLVSTPVPAASIPTMPADYMGISPYTTPTVSVAGIVPAGVGTPYPTYTPYPTLTPYPTFTPSVNWMQGVATVTPNSFLPSQVNFVFSYYYPALVSQEGMEANCSPDNYIYPDWDAEKTKIIGCRDTTASGARWSQYLMNKSIDGYKGGLAVPYYPDTLTPLYPMGSVFVVTSPASVAGRYLVIDICPACDDYIHTHGVLFLDFLAEGMPEGVTWWDDVEVSEVIYP